MTTTMKKRLIDDIFVRNIGKKTASTSGGGDSTLMAHSLRTWLSYGRKAMLISLRVFMYLATCVYRVH